MAIHFNRSPHELQDFAFQWIDPVKSSTSHENFENMLITNETYWSAQLFTIATYGLNKKQEFHSKIG